tara:strand:+ start:633 stop:857 length:225 start_codon:yes stop_codon:yes gene_type:complete
MGKQYVYYHIRKKVETILDELNVDYTIHSREEGWTSHKWDSRTHKSDKISEAYKKKYGINLIIQKHSVFEFDKD